MSFKVNHIYTSLFFEDIEIEFLYNERQVSFTMAIENYIPIQLVLGSQDSIEREYLTAVPYNFTIANEGKWEMLISDKDMEVKKGEVIEIPLKEVSIPENSVALPCAFIHHALGAVLKARHTGVALVETRRKISSVIFLPIQNGKVENGDLLAVINVFPIILNK